MASVTFATLKSRCLSYGYGTVDENNFGVWLNQTYNEVAGSFKWSWLEKNTSISTTANQAFTALPSDLQWFGRLAPNSGTDNWYVPEFVDEMDFRKYIPTKHYSSERAEPRYYTIFADQLNWSPVPDAVYTYRLAYWRTPTPLANANDVTLIPDVDVDVLVVGALQRAAMRENDMGKYQVYAAQFQANVAQMMRNEKSRQQQKIDRVPLPDHYQGVYDADFEVRRRP